MFRQTQLIRLLRSFGPSATVEMITLSEVFSILLVTCHHMLPTNCRVSLRGMTTSARHWLASNIKPLCQPASSHWLNLAFLQSRHHHKSEYHMWRSLSSCFLFLKGYFPTVRPTCSYLEYLLHHLHFCDYICRCVLVSVYCMSETSVL